MWWKHELEDLRREAHEARYRLTGVPDGDPHPASPSPMVKYLPELIAAGFAAGALVGRKRASKLVALAVPVVRIGMTLMQSLSMTTSDSDPIPGSRKEPESMPPPRTRKARDFAPH